MSKFLMALCLTLTASIFAFAQDDYKKAEFFVGFSNNQVDAGGGDDTDSVEDFFNDRASFNGFNVSAVGNINRYVGIKGDVSGAYRSDRFTQSITGTGIPANQSITADVDTSVYNFLGGIQIKDNSTEKRFKPFAHALIGAGHVRAKVDDFTCTSGIPASLCASYTDSISDTGFAAAFGGGIDVRAGNRVDIRVIQVDYNPMRVFGETSHNFRFGFGVVFK